jgi:hypothetical protein
MDDTTSRFRWVVTMLARTEFDNWKAVEESLVKQVEAKRAEHARTQILGALGINTEATRDMLEKAYDHAWGVRYNGPRIVDDEDEKSDKSTPDDPA